MSVRFLLIPLLTCFVVGCSGGPEDRPTLTPVSGTVVFKGKPVADATVAFWGEGAPRPAKGISDAEGKFTLSMFDFGDGAMTGPNKVTVTKVSAAEGNSKANDTAMMNDPQKLTEYQLSMTESDAKDKNSIPTKYASQQQTPLTETVATEGENTFVIQLAE